MKIEGRPTLELEVIIRLTEKEARAVEALGGYGEDAFVKFFYENLGRTYMQPYEEGLRSFLKTTGMLNTWLRRIDKSRKVFNEE